MPRLMDDRMAAARAEIAALRALVTELQQDNQHLRDALEDTSRALQAPEDYRALCGGLVRWPGGGPVASTGHGPCPF